MNKNPCRRFFIINRLQSSSSHDVNDDGMTKNKEKHRHQQRAAKRYKSGHNKTHRVAAFSGLNKFISSIFSGVFSVETVCFCPHNFRLFCDKKGCSLLKKHVHPHVQFLRACRNNRCNRVPLLVLLLLLLVLL